MVSRTLLLFCCLVLLACSGTAGRGSSLGDPNSLSEEAIRGSDARNAYELVEQLRPRWLRPGPDRSLNLETVILVYYDNVRLGSIDALRSLPLAPIRAMHVLDSVQAGALPGLGSQHVERVIMISTSPRR
jgi:hypothetical protein